MQRLRKLKRAMSDQTQQLIKVLQDILSVLQDAHATTREQDIKRIVEEALHNARLD